MLQSQGRARLGPKQVLLASHPSLMTSKFKSKYINPLGKHLQKVQYAMHSLLKLKVVLVA